MNPEDQRLSVGENTTKNISNLSPSQSEIGTKSLTPEQRNPTLDETRKDLAKFLTYTLAGTIVASFTVIVALTIMSGFLVDEKKTSSFDKTSALAKDLIVTILTSQIGLVGTAIGFYFGSRGNAD
jgi:hypothetical protein